MYCYKCGKVIDDISQFCIFCGATVSNPGAAASAPGVPAGYTQKSKVVAGLLQIVIGGLGISTLITLVLVPCMYVVAENVAIRIGRLIRWIFRIKPKEEESATTV